jgi:hypothetical protein
MVTWRGKDSLASPAFTQFGADITLHLITLQKLKGASVIFLGFPSLDLRKKLELIRIVLDLGTRRPISSAACTTS